MKRVVISVVILLVCASLVWSQGQYIGGHRTVVGGLNTGTTTGSANAYVLTLNPPLPGYVAYQCFTFLANHTNTDTATLNVNGHGPKAIKTWNSGVLADVSNGDITAGQYVHVCYDGTDMQVQSGSSRSVEGENPSQSCRHTRVNWLGASREPITVSNTPVTVAASHTSRCSLLIVNMSTVAVDSIQCADVSMDPAPTATTGLRLVGGAVLSLQLEGQGQWQCIRTTGTDVPVTVGESVP